MSIKSLLITSALLLLLLFSAVSCKKDFALHVQEILTANDSAYAICRDEVFKALVMEGDNAFGKEIDSLSQRGLLNLYEIPDRPVRVIEWRCTDVKDSVCHEYTDFIFAYNANGKTHTVTKEEFWENLKNALFADEDIDPYNYEICEFLPTGTADVYLLHINEVRGWFEVDMDKAGGFCQDGYRHSPDNIIRVRQWIHLLLKVKLTENGVERIPGVLEGYHTSGAKDGPVLDLGKSFLGFEGGHEWVDLGLPSGTRWAACNLGADSPTECGNRYSWGENHAKDVFAWDNCEMYKTPVDKRPTDISGLTDYDPVATEWGSEWRLPTAADFEELIQHTKGNRSWTTIDGVTGLRIVGPNGNAIFIPAAGYQDNQTVDGLNAHGSYWTANRSAGSKYVDYIALDCWGLHKSFSRIDHGRSIRPVLKPQ